MSGRRLVLAVAGIVAGLTAACSSGSAGSGTTAAKVVIAPGNGTVKARPDKGVSVTATGGVLDRVSVRAGGRAVGQNPPAPGHDQTSPTPGHD